jgi:hypothetical protein
MDLTTGWDFRLQSHKDAAKAYVENEKPLLIIGSPMCTSFSQLQRLNGGISIERWEEAVEHIKFVTELYEVQHKGGRLFLHEHPAQASSWALKSVQDLSTKKGVYMTCACTDF